MARRHRPSMRALHWDEAKHPRDDRGRFSRTGGGRWLAKALKQVEARFGDVHMGAAPGHQPSGRLQTGKGGLIDTRALSKAAPRIEARSPLGPVRPPSAGVEAARTGRTPAGLAAVAPAAPRVNNLKRGDHVRVSGVDQYGHPTTLNGHVQGVSPVRVGKRGSKRKEDMLQVQMAETPTGANGWRGTVLTKPDATAEHTTPRVETTASGAPVAVTDVNKHELGRTPTALTHQAPGAGPTRRGRTPSGVLAGGPAPEHVTHTQEVTRAEAGVDTPLDTSRVGRNAGGVTTTKQQPRSAADVEAELADARQALAEVDTGIGGGSLRSKAHGRRVNAGVGRAAKAADRVRSLEKELRSLRGEPESSTPAIPAREVSRAETLSQIDRAEYAAMPKAQRDEIARELTALRHGSDEGQRGIAAYTLGKLGLAPTPAERAAPQEAPGNRFQARYNPGGDNYHVVETDAQGHGLGVASQEFDTQEEAVRDAARRNSEDLAAFDAAQAPGGITDPLDQAMIREAIAERGGGYYGGPMGLSKGDAARYLSEGHLKDLTAKYGYDNVRTAVAAEIDRNPAALDLKPGSPEWKAAQAARLEASQAASRQAMEALKAGQHDEAARIIREAQQAHPSYRERGHSFADMLGFIGKEKAKTPALPEPSRTNTGPAADNAHGGNFAADVRAGLGSGDQLARETAPRAGRTPAGATGTIETPAMRAAAALNSATTREEAHAALKNLTTEELRFTAKRLNRTLAGLTNKQQMRERLVESTVGSRITSDVLRRNGMGPTGRGPAGVVGAPGSGFAEPPRAGGITPTAGQIERANEVARIENARANFGAGPASTKPEVGRRPDGSYKYDNYSQAGYDLGNLTVAEAGIPDRGAVHSQYQQILKHISTIQRQGPARVGSKDQYYRPMTKSLEQAAQYVHEHEGNPATVAKLRALADIYRPNTDKAPDLVSGADIRSQRLAMASDLGVDMTDPNRWLRGGDVRGEVFAKASRDIPQYYTHPDLMAAQQRLKNASIHDTAEMDAAALEAHRIGDRIRAQQADFASAGQRMKAALQGSGGLTDMETAVRADTRRLKKEYGIPGDAAIRKLPPGERQAAEAALSEIQKATRARVAQENNLKQVAIVRAEIARGGMSPVNAEAWAKRADRTENMATPEAIANAERERDLALAAWRHAKGATGTKGDYPAAQLVGLDHEEQMHVTVLARNVGIDAADNLAEEYRANKGIEAPGVNTDYAGFTPAQAEGLRGLEHNPIQHAAARERLTEMNRQQAETVARRAQELADVSSAPLPVHGASNEEQAAAMAALARQVDPNKFKGGKLFNEHVVDGEYSASIQDAYGKRVLNYDGRTGTWTNENGGQIAPNQVHAYIAEYNRHDNFSRDPNYMKSLVDSEVPPDFSTLPPPPVDTRPKMVQLQERKARIQRRLEGARGDVARQLRYQLHDVNQDIEAEQAAVDKAARTAPAGPASDRFKPGDYLGPGEAYVHRADLVGHTVTFNAPVPGSRAGKRQDITGKVVDVKSLSGGTSTHIVIEGRSRPLVLDSGLNVVEPKGGKGAPAGKYAKLSDEQIRNALEMRGSTDAELVAEAKRRGIPINPATEAGRVIGGQDTLIRSLGEPEKDAHGAMLVPGDEITIASRLHNREGERAHVIATGTGKASGVQLAEVRYANGDIEQVMTGNIVRTTPAGKRYLDNLRAELGSQAPAALAEISGERPRDVAVLQAEARKRGNAAIKGRLEQAAHDLEVIRRGNASSDMIIALDRGAPGKAEAGAVPASGVDTSRVTRNTGNMTPPHSSLSDEQVRNRLQGDDGMDRSLVLEATQRGLRPTGGEATFGEREILLRYFRAEYGSSASMKSLQVAVDALSRAEIETILGAVRAEPHLVG